MAFGAPGGQRGRLPVEIEVSPKSHIHRHFVDLPIVDAIGLRLGVFAAPDFQSGVLAFIVFFDSQVDL